MREWLPLHPTYFFSTGTGTRYRCSKMATVMEAWSATGLMQGIAPAFPQQMMQASRSDPEDSTWDTDKQQQ